MAEGSAEGAEGVYVQLLGRHGTFTAIVEPRRTTALVGAIVLEDLDLLVDCTAEQRVVPRDPRNAVLRSSEPAPRSAGRGCSWMAKTSAGTPAACRPEITSPSASGTYSTRRGRLGSGSVR